jgi:hypothetical protein
MEHAQLDSEEWPHIVARLGGEEALKASAREHKAFIRARGVKSAADVLRLCLAYGPGGHSLRTSAATAAAHGVADISDVAVLGRVRQAGDWLEHLCCERVKLVAQAIGGLTERPLRIVDGSRLVGPGNRAWRLHLCYDASLGRIIDAKITTTREGEKLDRLAITRGEIRLGDRGYPQPDGIRKTLEAGADLVVRLTWSSLQLTDAAGKPLDWLSLFTRSSMDGSLDMPVQVHKARGPFEALAMRLVILRKPAAAVPRAVAKARHTSSKNKRTIDPRTLAAAEHIILLTSLDQDEFAAEQIGTLYRLRWQIELAIKRLKSILHIDELPAKAPDLARAWLYAHLLFALILDEKSAETGALSP